MIKFADMQRMVERQAGFQWGDKYQPSTFATTREGSRISRISRLNSARLGRALHLQSTSETLFAKFALYHPRVFDLHEQKMLFPVPHQHPLDGHPTIIGAELPYLEGTVSVARRIGFVHKQVIAELEDGSKVRAPYPYQGDLLLYLKDENSNPYAVNWNLKATPADFKEKSRSAVKTPQQQKKSKVNQVLRNELEEQYYASAGIRTHKLTPENLDSKFAANLNLIFSFHLKQYTVDSKVLNDYSLELQESLSAGIPLSIVAIQYSKKWGFRDQFISKIYRDIWDRKLLVNLFEPVRIDHALESQVVDALDLYKYLFAEDTQ